jgi:hypothetical protein
MRDCLENIVGAEGAEKCGIPEISRPQAKQYW